MNKQPNEYENHIIIIIIVVGGGKLRFTFGDIKSEFSSSFRIHSQEILPTITLLDLAYVVAEALPNPIQAT